MNYVVQMTEWNINKITYQHEHNPIYAVVYTPIEGVN